MKSWGLETEVRAYDVWMPHPTGDQAVARRARHAGARSRRAAGAGDPPRRRRREDHRQRLQRHGRRERARRVRELRPDRGLRAARLDGRVGEGQDRHRALRPLVPRHQGARGGEARRGRADHLQRSRRTMASCAATCIPEGPMRAATGVQRGSVMQRRRRSDHARLSESSGRAAHPAERDGGPAHSRGADRLRQRRGAAARTCAARRSRRRGRAGFPFRYHVGPGPVAARVVRAQRHRDEARSSRSTTPSASCAAASSRTRS